MGELEPKRGSLFVSQAENVPPGEFFLFEAEGVQPDDEIAQIASDIKMAGGFTLADKLVANGIIISLTKIGKDCIVLINKAWEVIFPDNLSESGENGEG